MSDAYSSTLRRKQMPRKGGGMGGQLQPIGGGGPGRYQPGQMGRGPYGPITGGARGPGQMGRGPFGPMQPGRGNGGRGPFGPMLPGRPGGPGGQGGMQPMPYPRNGGFPGMPGGGGMGPIDPRQIPRPPMGNPGPLPPGMGSPVPGGGWNGGTMPTIPGSGGGMQPGGGWSNPFQPSPGGMQGRLDPAMMQQMMQLLQRLQGGGQMQPGVGYQ